jgi:glycosyltransferase involved in cell wall biosynthesis
MKTITIVSPCYNEEKNVELLYREVKKVFEDLDGYQCEFIFIDNHSTDGTQDVLRRLAAEDASVKLILNARNFGSIPSSYHGLVQGTGDAVVGMVSDLQDPPWVVREFVKRWERGAKIVVGVAKSSKESWFMASLRRAFYALISAMSETQQIRHFNGFGLYDRKVIEVLRSLDDPFPYLRGLVADLGWDLETVEYDQPPRQHGTTSTNLFYLYGYAMTGFVSQSQLPLKIATMFGLFTSAVYLIVAAIYLAYKLVLWDSFDLGMAPVVIGLFFFSSLQLIFLGVVGECIGDILKQTVRRPLVIERERINFPEAREG